METMLKDLGWALWARGGECYFERGDDRVMASAEIDGHVEGLPSLDAPVFIALCRTPIGPEVAALLGGYAGGVAPEATATIPVRDFLLLPADFWYDYLSRMVDAAEGVR